jgi:hypothetical protein
MERRLRGGHALPLLLLQRRPATTRTRRRAHPERILAVRQAYPAALDQPAERIPIQLVQRLSREAHILELHRKKIISISITPNKRNEAKQSNPPQQNTSAHSPSGGTTSA